MKKTSSEKYLGELISNTGNIDLNIQARANKGNGSVNTIMSLLEEISFGEHYFYMAILFRNSMLINSLLSSSEALYGIETKHIKILEKCDRDLLSRLFSVPFTCSYEAVFLETGCLPIRFILQGRRLMYYWALLNKPDHELVKKFLNVQKVFSSDDDWICQVEEDKKELEIHFSENEIKDMKKETFKKLLKSKLHEKAYQFLSYSRGKHSKTKNLKTFTFQTYLQSGKFTTKEKKLLFSLRTRSIDVKTNYKNKHKFNMQCSLCEDENDEESEIHLLKCAKIIEKIGPNVNLANARYENIFSDKIEDQVAITKVFDLVFKTKDVLMKQLKD